MHKYLTLVVLVFASAANADWTVTEDDGKTTATLHNTITPDDGSNVPEADHYHVNSPGGSVWAGVKIMKALKGKSVSYTMAYSAAAMIATELGATPASDKATLGFHWSAYPEGMEVGPEEAKYLTAMNAQMLKSMKKSLAPALAAYIIDQMNGFKDNDQGLSMIFYSVKTNRSSTIVDGELTDQKAH
tara:strand:- start:411 stop:971 length:561 start_codon:yes stop_codon:yes gene_type:complete